MSRLLLAAVSLLLAACGGGDGGGNGEASADGDDVVAPAAWIGDFCAVGVDWQGDLEENAASLETRVADAEGLEEVRRELGRYFDRAAELTDSAVARLDEAGVPDVEDREQLVEDFTGLIVDLGALFRDAGQDVRELDTAEEAAFRRRVTQIAERLQRRSSEVVSEFTALAARYDVPELDRAFEENEDCAQFSGAD